MKSGTEFFVVAFLSWLKKKQHYPDVLLDIFVESDNYESFFMVRLDCIDLELNHVIQYAFVVSADRSDESIRCTLRLALSLPREPVGNAFAMITHR